MKKVALYSSSSRSRKDPPGPVDVQGAAAETAPQAGGGAPANGGGAPANGGGSPPPVRGRLRRFYRRFEQPILVGAGALFAAGLLAIYAGSRPVPQELTQKDIDAAVMHTLESANLPSMATRAAAAIAPSVVRVMGYSADADDEKDARAAGKGRSDDPGNATPKGKAPAPAGKSRAATREPAKDRLARNDAGKGPDGGTERAGKAREAARDKDPKDPKDPPATPRKDPDDEQGGFPGYRSSGVGTGVVIVDKGVILTNLHVVLGAEKIKVRFFDGMEAEAVVVGMRPEHDLAVLQAKAVPDDLQAATLRSTADLQVGDQVVAVGFPFGIGPSASAGVVSGLKREYHSPEGKRILTNLIQFDAAANPGNSGGPLVTADGEVVGIVTGILNPTKQRVFIGIGFAVPIENAAAAAGMSPF